MKTIIQNGTVITAGDTFKADVVLENGKIKESGTHADLMKKDNGIYKNLSTIQLMAV